MNELKGKTVKLAPGWRTADEADARYTVAADDGERLTITLNCDMPIPPQERVTRDMIEVVPQ